MKDSSWKDCIENDSVRRSSPDMERANSLDETAEARISLVNEVNEKNCNFVFEDYYTSLLEVLQALIIRRGYKVLNHLCIGFFIRDVLEDTYLYKKFDDLRYKRNSLTYYGNRLDYETAKGAIEDCKYVMDKIKYL